MTTEISVMYGSEKVKCGHRLYTLESAVYRRHSLMYKDRPRTVRVKVYFRSHYDVIITILSLGWWFMLFPKCITPPNDMRTVFI